MLEGWDAGRLGCQEAITLKGFFLFFASRLSSFLAFRLGVWKVAGS
jgi:hypothetical protein